MLLLSNRLDKPSGISSNRMDNIERKSSNQLDKTGISSAGKEKKMTEDG